MRSKGQVTIPKEVRRLLNLRAGDRLEFRVEPEGTVRLFPIARRVSEVYGMLAEKVKRGRSSGEIDAALADSFKKPTEG
ncbi:MAG: AbrB/MazE/SpoVT family DNA-binding domain-containing protein [bacterium]|nr:AbrB/MazE/SpoVT family DNA-binding domain-containing protein [bacterium]